MKGFGVEAEFRQIQYRQVQDAHYYQTTFGGGPIYSLRRYRNFRPYGKFIVDCGHMNFKIAKFPPGYTSDIWTVYAPGAGVEYRAWRNVWVRADYEYMFWKTGFYNNHYLNPNGAIIGVEYDFGHKHAY